MIRPAHPLRRQSAAVLLEVLLAVALFVAAAAIATASLNSSLRSLERQRLQTHAVQHASSILAELQLGIRSASGGSAAAQPFETPFQDWTWEIVTDSGASDFSESNPLERVEVIIRHRTEPIVQRLAQRLPPRISNPTASTNSLFQPPTGGTGL
jgi:type II secretory pathway pseudopilin PulG